MVNRSKNRFTTATALLDLRDEAGRVDAVLGRGQAEDQCTLLSFSTNQILEQLPGKLVAAEALRTIGMYISRDCSFPRMAALEIRAPTPC
mgnify:CR=1 FL=1